MPVNNRLFLRKIRIEEIYVVLGFIIRSGQYFLVHGIEFSKNQITALVLLLTEQSNRPPSANLACL